MTIRIATQHLVLRVPRMEDVESIARHANSRRVWLGLRDRFPHPYSTADASAFLRAVTSESSLERAFAIDLEGEAIGVCSILLQDDVYRRSGEIGYWLGEPFHGRGLATEAVGALTRYGLDRLELHRLWCHIFASNPASARVVEKNGYQLEGTLRDAAFKDDRFVDVLVYARLRGEP